VEMVKICRVGWRYIDKTYSTVTETEKTIKYSVLAQAYLIVLVAEQKQLGPWTRMEWTSWTTLIVAMHKVTFLFSCISVLIQHYNMVTAHTTPVEAVWPFQQFFLVFFR